MDRELPDGAVPCFCLGRREENCQMRRWEKIFKIIFEKVARSRATFYCFETKGERRFL